MLDMLSSTVAWTTRDYSGHPCERTSAQRLCDGYGVVAPVGNICPQFRVASGSTLGVSAAIERVVEICGTL